MNEEEKNTVNVCQERDSKDVLKKQNHEVVTPIRRSTRIKKTKASDEDSNKVVDTSNEILKNIVLSKEKVESDNFTSNNQASTDANCNPSTVSNANKGLKTNDTCFQTNNGEEESIQAMFDDIFEQNSRTVQSFLPKKSSNDSGKERKFFKRDCPETPILNLCYRSNLPAEDVSKVFKIISKPNPLPDIIDSKSTPRPLLKTYSNKRKLCKKTNVIESFGLPDHPIASENMQPLLNDELDVSIEDVNDITILDNQYIKEPWIITAEGEDFFPLVEEIRTKSEPIHDPFKKNGSFLDFADSFETFMEPAIFTSSPFNSEVHEDNSSLPTALKSTRNTKVHRNKEIDIEAIKINFKKILSRTDVTETQKPVVVKRSDVTESQKLVAVKKPSNSLTKKKNSIVSANGDILFVEDNSLTIENKEFEFSNKLIVPKSNSSNVGDKSEKNIQNGSKVVKRILRSSLNNDEKKFEELEANKNKLRTSSKKQKSFTENEIRETVEDNVPKKDSETDSTSKCNCHIEKADPQKNTKESDKITSEGSSFDKRRLRSSSQSRSPRREAKNSNENSTNKTDNNNMKKSSASAGKVLAGAEKKLETVMKKSRPSSHTKSEQSKNVSPLIPDVAVKNKRLLRSASQDSLGQEKSSDVCNNPVEKLSRQTNKVMSDVKVNLQKCKFNGDMDRSATSNSSSNTQETLQENKGRDKLLSPLKSARRSLPEITIILNPLDIAKLNEKLPEHSKIPVYDMMSPTRRKLRSTKTTSQRKTDQSEGDSVNEIAERIDKNKKDSLGTELDPTKIKKRGSKTKGGKAEETKSNVFNRNKFKSKSLTSIDSLMSSSKDGVEKPIKKHHSLCSDIRITDKSEFVTTLTKEALQNTDTEKHSRQPINETTSCEFRDSGNDTNTSENCEEMEMNSPKATIPKRVHEAEQSIETNINQAQRKDENINSKCDEGVQHNLNLSNNKYKCSESQVEENEKLKSDNSLSESTKIFLDSTNKNNASDAYNPKVEETSFSDLLKKEEEKAIISTKIINKVLATTYLDKTKLLHLDIGNIIIEEYKSTDLSSDSQCDKTKTSIILKSSPIANLPEDTAGENSSISNSQSQDITGKKLQARVSENSSENEKENATLYRQDARDKIGETLLEERALPLTQTESQSKSNSVEKSNETSHINKEKEIVLESKTEANNAPIKIRNEIVEQPEKAGKPSESNARLKEKRRKLLGSKAFTAEESIKRRPPNEIHPTKIQENSTEVNHACGPSVEQPLPVCRKRGRPRKSENIVLPQKPTKHNSRGRLSRRKSLDDMDLLHRYNEYRKERVARSKSVAPSTPESRRWQNRDKELIEGNLEDKTIKIKTLMKHGNKSEDITSLTYKTNDFKKSVNTKKIQNPGNLTSLENLISDSKNFKIGDITWAHIGGYPYWPCLITKEMGTKHYKKIFQGKQSQRELYHVRFFGDKGRRAWIRKERIMLYSSCDDLKLLKNKMKQKNKYIPLSYTVKTHILQKWERAVKEAEQVKSKNVKEKLLFFTDMFTNAKKKESAPVVPKSPPVTTKRKSDEHYKSTSRPNKKSNDEKTKKTNKKNVSNENEQIAEDTLNKEEITDDVNQIPHIENHIQRTKNILNKMNLRRQIDEISEIDSKTSSDNIADSDTSLNSMEKQKVLYKRNNLFKGISRDKVCQYCFKPGDVLKCRGRCNGSYHVSCSLEILLEKTPQKEKKRVNKEKNTTTHRKAETISKNTDISSSSVALEVTNQDKKVDDKNTEEKDSNKSPLTEQDHVQIITVPSGVYNTPPRKTFPPDFKNMTLAEQIDYKMKEIMRKFEAKTFYADSCVESSSEEHTGNPVLIQANQLNASFLPTKKNDEKAANNNLTFPKPTASILPIKKNEEKKTSELTPNNTINKKLVFPKPNETPKPVESVDKLNPIAKKVFFFKHVTADCDIIKIDMMPEEKSNSLDGSEVDPKNFKCGFCISDLYPHCFICHLAVSRKGSNIRQKCSIYPCGRFYHPECLKMWPQTQWSLIQTTRHKESDKDMDSFVCPLHVCHTCVSDDPRAATARCSGDKIVKCLLCPSTYHSSNLCVPAGTEILSSSQILCPRHREKIKPYTINTTWCFLCSKGGNLICCETCPTSVHPECLPVNLTDDDKFICEDCESGRLPLYDEIVWVKLGKFRWWPALILFPNEIPDNVRNMKHSIGDFVVKFFGTYDHHWVNKGRSFLFQEGDTGQCNSVRKKVDAAFNRAVEEAVVAHKLKKEFKLSQEVEPITSLKPPPYIRIKVNKPVGNVRHLDLDLSSTNACECDPNKPHPCGPESDCLNRLLLTECNPEVCPAGTRCKNQSFEKREYPPLLPYKTQSRGWGLKTLAPIKKGQFVIEYVGELIDSEEYQRRIQKMHEQKEENYYFLTIDKDRMIDAGPKGNAARFMNHCCQPNCETQKWTVNGDTRVGLFATEEIPADTELTFNYNLECVGKEKKVCRCGAPNCSGFIGVKAKQDADLRKPKKNVKKKVPVEPVILPPCFICGKKGLVISCNNKVCNKTYHQKCLKTTEQIEGNKFICPWHNCSTCSKRTIRCCVKCINSYCPSHSDGNIRYDNLLGFVCTVHDPMTPPNDVQPVYKKKNGVITEETAVTSTTSDDTDDEEDWMPLLTRYKRMNAKRVAPVDSESGADSNVNRFSRSQQQQSIVSDYESQDEGAVSSATPPDEVRVGVKRKRGRPRKRHRQAKKIKLSNEENSRITASSSVVESRLRSHCSSELTRKNNNLENR